MAADTPRNGVTVPPSVLADITGRPVPVWAMQPGEYEALRVELGARAADALHDQNHQRTTT